MSKNACGNFKGFCTVWTTTCLAQQRARRPCPRTVQALSGLLSCTTTGKTTLSKHCATNELQLWDLDRLLHVWTRQSSPRLQPRNCGTSTAFCTVRTSTCRCTTTGTSTTLSDKTCTTNATGTSTTVYEELVNLDGFRSNLNHGDQPLCKDGGVNDLRRTANAELPDSFHCLDQATCPRTARTRTSALSGP